ncbi:RSP_7527 family protein [Celeribacter arenosi]
MKSRTTYHTDFEAIERRAHEMRAEAARDLVKSLRSWLRSRSMRRAKLV